MSSSSPEGMAFAAEAPPPPAAWRHPSHHPRQLPALPPLRPRISGRPSDRAPRDLPDTLGSSTAASLPAARRDRRASRSCGAALLLLRSCSSKLPSEASSLPSTCARRSGSGVWAGASVSALPSPREVLPDAVPSHRHAERTRVWMWTSRSERGRWKSKARGVASKAKRRAPGVDAGCPRARPPPDAAAPSTSAPATASSRDIRCPHRRAGQEIAQLVAMRLQAVPSTRAMKGSGTMAPTTAEVPCHVGAHRAHGLRLLEVPDRGLVGRFLFPPAKADAAGGTGRDAAGEAATAVGVARAAVEPHHVAHAGGGHLLAHPGLRQHAAPPSGRVGTVPGSNQGKSLSVKDSFGCTVMV